MDTELLELDAPALPPLDVVLDDAPVATATVRVPARLLEYDRDKFVALPIHTAYEILEHAPVVSVPGAPYYGLGMLRWQGQWLPVIDLCALLNAYPKPGSPPKRHVLVVAYQTAPRQALQYFAIATVALTSTVQVADADQCALPGDSDLWPLIALSCFEHAGQPVPIIDTARLFNALV